MQMLTHLLTKSLSEGKYLLHKGVCDNVTEVKRL